MISPQVLGIRVHFDRLLVIADRKQFEDERAVLKGESDQLEAMVKQLSAEQVLLFNSVLVSTVILTYSIPYRDSRDFLCVLTICCNARQSSRKSCPRLRRRWRQ